jgi:hypothetical protein
MKAMHRFPALLVFISALSVATLAQQNPLEPGKSKAVGAEVGFELNWAAADPQWFAISVAENGQASYQSKPGAKKSDTGADPYSLNFVASQPTRTKIFELAKELNFFQGKFESKYKVAKTGDKTLSYSAGQQNSKTTLNYSDNPQMNQLIDIFQKMSITFETSRKLDYDIRFDKLGLERDLKAMEELNKNHGLMELQVISPTLEKIANDATVMNISRQRARRLLDQAGAANGSR